jgi:AcrR family transcriptional regulator
VPSADRSGARGRLLQTARRRFAADGAIAATLEEIRCDAEVSVGALYHHFTDKPALAAAVYAQVMGEYQAGFVAMLRRHATAEGGIRGGVAHHLRWVVANRSEAALLLGDRLDSAELGECNRSFFAAVRDWWRPHHTYGALRPMQAGITAALWFGPAQEFSRYWIAGDEPRMPRGVVKTFADAAWKALRANAIQEDE